MAPCCRRAKLHRASARVEVSRGGGGARTKYQVPSARSEWDSLTSRTHTHTHTVAAAWVGSQLPAPPAPCRGDSTLIPNLHLTLPLVSTSHW